MTDIIEEHIANINHFMDIELQDLKKLEGDKLNNLKFLLQIDDMDVGSIYYNEYNMVFLFHDDYVRLSKLIPNFETTLKIEVLEFNTHIFVGRYINCNQINEMLNR